MKTYRNFSGRGKTRGWPVHMTIVIYKNTHGFMSTKPSMHHDKQFWDNAIGESFVSHKSALWANQKNYGLSATEK